MQHTKNALVKSNSVAVLIPTSTHLLMVSQKHITYPLQNIHRQTTTYLSLCTLCAYSAIPFRHSLNVCTCTLHFLSLEGDNILRFGTQETHTP
jgi:hypothetical protein